ncbi:MAG: DUF1848 domain-containing protein [Bacteroidetes bacterium]|nr:DUF1848 domain-containing protein [Bacteroidota bacterium]
MIISASRRTDIPCYYSEWFIKRLQAGYVLTRNPMNYSQVSRVSLSQDVVDCIVFWTKDAENILDKLKYIDTLGYNYYFQYTITPYGIDIEKNLRPKKQIIENFKLISSLLGKHRVLWRYDPIIINEVYTVEYHKKAFTEMCRQLSQYTNSVVISFVDLYAKLRLKEIQEIPLNTIEILAEVIGSTARKYSIKVQSCCENIDLTPFEIHPGSCIDQSVIEKACGCKLKLKPDKGQRKYCNCAESIDIGAYNTCLNGCLYCYANCNDEKIRLNYEKHDPSAEFLLGVKRSTDSIYDRQQKSSKV